MPILLIPFVPSSSGGGGLSSEVTILNESLDVNVQNESISVEVINGEPIEITGSVTFDQPVAITGVVTLPAIVNPGITELIGINERVDNGEFSPSVGISLGSSMSGEIISILLLSTESGTGALKAPKGTLYFFAADPAPAENDTAFTASEWATLVGKVDVVASDWVGDTAGLIVYLTTAIPFHALSTIYTIFKITNNTSFNDAAGDDEKLEVNIWVRKDG